MESADASVKSPGRLRSKSSRLSTSPNPSNINLNGEEDITELSKSLEDKEDDIFESSTDDVLSGDQKSEDFDSRDENKTADKVRQESKPTKGRKRKASEMKSSDENTSDEPPTKDKPALREDEEKFESTPEDDVLKSDEKIVSDSTSDIGISLDMKTDAHSLGKGKRARVPNKRYSDFPLKSSRLSQSDVIDELDKSRPNLENGEAKEGSEHTESAMNVDLKDDGSEKSSVGSPNVILKTNSSIRTNRTGSPSTPAVKKSKPPVDLSNPCYLKPFKYGWKRELVYRATNDINTNKRNGDIYYYTPNGRKVRSMREVSENLKNKELTLDDFTFFKEPLGIDDPEKEIIRDAKIKTSTPLLSKKSTPKVTRTPKVSSPKPTTVTESQVDSTNKAKASPRRTSFKVKLPSRGAPQSKPKVEKKTSKNDSDLDIGTYPPNWTTPVSKKPSKTPTRGKKKKQKIAPASKSESETEDYKFMDSYLQNVAYGYNTLLYVFQYLKVQDLLRASCVCSMWRDIASHPMLWKTVRMKNSQIHNFGGLADALEKHGTVHLDLRKMLLPSTSGDDIWQEFTREIEKVISLRKIELCRCPAFVVEQLPISNPKLQVINSVTIKCETMSLAPMIHLKELQELRLKSTAGFALTSDLTALSDLKHLKHLSLTSIKELNKLNIDVIADLRNLESLELGECTDFPKNFGSEILTRLTKLEKLRLEKGQGNCYTFEILEAVKNMQHLYQLELVNFDIKPGFDLALGACPNIKKLLIIPTYISQSATTNHMVLGGVLRLQSTLSQFVWGVTLELLRVTELFVDQCEEDKDKKEKRPIANGDSIPVLKPVPLAREGMAAEILPAQEPPQVEILPLPNLQKLLLSSLPTTRVKILKIPFHATWRQSIHDSVN